MIKLFAILILLVAGNSKNKKQIKQKIGRPKMGMGKSLQKYFHLKLNFHLSRKQFLILVFASLCIIFNQIMGSCQSKPKAPDSKSTQDNFQAREHNQKVYQLNQSLREKDNEIEEQQLEYKRQVQLGEKFQQKGDENEAREKYDRAVKIKQQIDNLKVQKLTLETQIDRLKNSRSKIKLTQVLRKNQINADGVDIACSNLHAINANNRDIDCALREHDQLFRGLNQNQEKGREQQVDKLMNNFKKKKIEKKNVQVIDYKDRGYPAQTNERLVYKKRYE